MEQWSSSQCIFPEIAARGCNKCKNVSRWAVLLVRCLALTNQCMLENTVEAAERYIRDWPRGTPGTMTKSGKVLNACTLQL